MKKADRCMRVDDEKELDDALRAKERVIALFHASWCPFCARFLPVFEKHADTTDSEGLDFTAVRDDESRIGDRYAVEIMPTVLFFKKGKVAKRLDGVLGVGLNEKQLTDFIHTCSTPTGSSIK
jgi:thiol-disulfide isomerase/thioredoxin